MSLLRTLLVLGRVSNLPTVWSNCLAGWWLGGGENFQKLPFVFAGATLLYVGGMFLNDAFDVEFDRQYRKERPILSGAISLNAVWAWGLAWMVLGLIGLFCVSKGTAALGIVLSLCIFIYDAIHKRVAWAPVLMGACRLLLYVVAASAAIKGVTGWACWGGLALALYIVGLSYQARGESTQGALRYAPALLLASPIVLAQFMNAGGFRERALLLSAVFGLWALKSLRYSLWSPEANLGRTVSGLLAGIVLVDWLAAGPDAPREVGLVFIGLFVLTLVTQRFVPAT